MKRDDTQVHCQPRRKLMRRLLEARSRGQALVIIALTMTVLILFVGLGVDAANLMGKKAKLQSAVDAAVLSGAQELLGGTTITQTASTKAYQMLQANGILTNTLNTAGTQVTFPANNQISMHATQRVDTFFMRLIPAFTTVDISVDATADLNSYSELNAKPYGKPGVVSELNLSVWGVNSWRRGGDAYSPVSEHDGSGTYGGCDTCAIIRNPEYDKQPYGYLYRVDVPASYLSSHNDLVIQIFDPDSYNRPDPPPTPPPTPAPGSCYPSPCSTPVPQATPTSAPDGYGYTYCPNYINGKCTTNPGSPRWDPGLKLNAYPNQRPSFWRVDEGRHPVTDARGIGPGPGETYQDSWSTVTQYTLWHFNPYITSAFGNPDTLSDQPDNPDPSICGSPTYPGLRKCIAQYTATRDITKTDLKWYQPNGFKIQLRGGPGCTKGTSGSDCFDREARDGMYFYLYIQGIDGSSENNFDLRSGSSSGNIQCDDIAVTTSNMYKTDCYVNQLYYDNVNNGVADWDTGGTFIFAKRSMVVNLDTGNNFPMLFTQLKRTAAGQTLGIRHFDQDVLCSAPYNCTGQVYEMQKCLPPTGAQTSYQPCTTPDPSRPGTLDDSCFDTLDSGSNGTEGPNDAWSQPGHPDPEPVQIPAESSDPSSKFVEFFGPGPVSNPSQVCTDSWLRLQRDYSGSQDTTVWEMPFIRPRLIK